MYSYVSHLYCPKCGDTLETNKQHQLCTCGSPLMVAYHLDEVKKKLSPDVLQSRESTLWRYHELLPVEDQKNVVSMGEGITPLIPFRKLGSELGVENLYMKDEGQIPTGSFKARGAAVGVSKAKEIGVTELAMPTNGNAGAAWGLYAARAGLKSTIVMPDDAPKITRNEVALSGADLYLVNGLISDAGSIVKKAVKDYNMYDASTLKEPYRIEGKKTMGLEIAEQLNWKMPDVILYPTGGGVGLIGIYKALQELKTLGWVDGKLPRLVAVQSTGCAPIVKAWEEGKQEADFWPDSETLAFGINVPKALGDFLVLDAIYDTDGCAVAVDDESMVNEQERIANMEGIFICPEGAATFAAIRKLREDSWVQSDETVVALNTGAGIKYPDTVQLEPKRLEKGDTIVKADMGTS